MNGIIFLYNQRVQATMSICFVYFADVHIRYSAFMSTFHLNFFKGRNKYLLFFWIPPRYISVVWQMHATNAHKLHDESACDSSLRTLWRHQMGIFSALLAHWAGNPPVTVSSLLNRLFRCVSKETSKPLRITGLCEWNPVDSPKKLTSNAENVSIWWRHHGRSLISWMIGSN